MNSLRHGMAALLLALCATTGQAAERVLTVFAAASLTNVLQEAGDAYMAETNQPVRWRARSSPARRPMCSCRPTRTG
jgi:ABC-type molybdate transport system substrate-binding protein